MRMHLLHANRHHQQSPHRRRLSTWAATHAWKLAGLTALVTFLGVFIAVTLSLVLRPTRSYFFPLLSDVDKHQPEGAILRIALIASTALLLATTSASLLHCRSMRIFRCEHQHTEREQTDNSETEHVSEITPVASPTKRRSVRLTSLQITIMIPLCITVLMTFLQYSGLGPLLYEAVHRQSLIKIAGFLLAITWVFAMCFLVWYFLKLQNMPDRVNTELPTRVELGIDGTTFPNELQSAESSRNWSPLRHWASWCVVILRPICLTGQAVCVIKIVGLWLALDTFSIADIRLVKITLLAALAFAEYTAAFFFAFFMSMLAVDMRSKAILPENAAHELT